MWTNHGTVMKERHLFTHLSFLGQPSSRQGSQNRVHPMFLGGPMSEACEELSQHEASWGREGSGKVSRAVTGIDMRKMVARTLHPHGS